jgi:hypothetical protein
MKRGRPRRFLKDETFTAEELRETLIDDYRWQLPQVYDLINTMRRHREDADATVET